MLEPLLAGFLVFIVAVYVRLSRVTSYVGGIPRVGDPGVLGYLRTALRYTVDAESVILESRKAFPGRPFALPTFSGPVFLLPPKHLERIRSSTDEVFNEPMAINEDLQLPYTMNSAQMENPYQATVVRTDLNRAIPALIPEILDESILAMDELFASKGEKGPYSIPIFDTMTHLIARISNRVLVGTELGRNKDFIHAIVRFAETTPLMAPFITWSPILLRPAVYFVLSSIFGGKKGALKFIVPFLQRYIKEREVLDEKPALLTEFLIRSAPPHETVEGIAMRLMNMNFGSIHTSSIFITQTLFELALLPESQLNEMREEIKTVLESEGGWTKIALLKLRKVDSALREVGRVYGLMYFALPRVALLGYDLGDGTAVPPGYRVAIDMTAIHFDPAAYPNPHSCDLFRFSKLRDSEDSDTKYGFATVDSHYLPFGAGRHACAGRFFAAMELKIMLAHILLKYDFRFPPEMKGRPKNITFNGAIVPDPKAHLIFSERTSDRVLCM